MQKIRHISQSIRQFQQHSKNIKPSQKKNTVDINSNYYFYDITDKLRLICLDLYEMSVIGYESNDENYKNAMELIRRFNENKGINDSTVISKFSYITKLVKFI